MARIGTCLGLGRHRHSGFSNHREGGKGVDIRRVSLGSVVQKTDRSYIIPAIAAFQIGLGMSLVDQQKFKQAQSLLLEGYATLKASFGQDHPRTKQAVENIVTFYEAWDAAVPNKGKAALAVEWRSKLTLKIDTPNGTNKNE